MKDLLRWFGRAFVSRIAWFIAGLVLLAVAGKSHASLVCASGSKEQWVYNSTNAGTGATTAAKDCLAAVRSSTLQGSLTASDACVLGTSDPAHVGKVIVSYTGSSPSKDTFSNGAVGTASTVVRVYATSFASSVAVYFNVNNIQSCGIGNVCPDSGTALPGVGFIGNVSDTITTVQYGGTYCKVEGQGLCMGMPGGSPGTACSKGWNYTGVEGSAPASTQPTQGFTDGKVCSSDGTRCVPIASADCGTVNGKYVCLSSSPAPGGCVTSATQTVCTANTSNPLVNPPAPGTSTTPGAPGTVTPPLAVIGQPSGTGAGGYLGGTSVNVWGPGGAGGATPGTGTTDPSAPPQPCGGDGQPKCNVIIDETGVTAAGGDATAELAAKITAADAEVASAMSDVQGAIAANEPVAGWDPKSMLPSLPTGSCQPINIEFFNGSTKAFPPPQLCDAIDSTFKPVLGFFFYLLTGYGCILAVVRARAGQA